MKKLLSIILTAAVLAVTLSACSGGKNVGKGNVGEVVLEKGDTYAVISIENYGDITFELFPDIAPNGVKRFKELADSGFYDGKNIHRVMANFMFQGGSETGDGRSSSTMETFDIETSYNARHFYGALCFANSMGKNAEQFYVVNNKTATDISQYSLDAIQSNADAYGQYAAQATGVSKDYYTSLQNTMLNLKDFIQNATDAVKEKYLTGGGAATLDGGYTVFGQAVSGFEVIDSLSAVKVTASSSGEDSLPTEDIIISSVKVGTFEG